MNSVKCYKAPQAFLEKLVELNGECKTVAEWCKSLGLDAYRVYQRKNRCMPWEEALTKNLKAKNISLRKKELHASLNKS